MQRTTFFELAVYISQTPLRSSLISFQYINKSQTKLKLGHIPEGAIFGTIDVVGLYPHIPHKDSLDSMKNVLSKFKEKINVNE